MDGDGVHLHREQETMLMTLYLHALYAESTKPILADHYSAQLVDRIDYDFSRLDKLRGNLPLIVGRARAIDVIVRDYLVEHADALAGCRGLIRAPA